MSHVDFRRYKRIVQGIFDQEPRNDDVSGASIWCLGKEYPSKEPLNDSATLVNGRRWHGTGIGATSAGSSSEDGPERHYEPAEGGADKDAVFRLGGGDIEMAWPAEFLDDCEARIWLTYRSGFPPIIKSADASVTFSVRLRSMADKQGFTSDTGWGCMIRSGQCLLANALSVLKMGRSRSSGDHETHLFF